MPASSDASCPVSALGPWSSTRRSRGQGGAGHRAHRAADVERGVRGFAGSTSSPGGHVANALAYGQTGETPPLHDAVAWRFAVALAPPWQDLVAPTKATRHALEFTQAQVRWQNASVSRHRMSPRSRPHPWSARQHRQRDAARRARLVRPPRRDADVLQDRRARQRLKRPAPANPAVAPCPARLPLGSKATGMGSAPGLQLPLRSAIAKARRRIAHAGGARPERARGPAPLKTAASL